MSAVRVQVEQEAAVVVKSLSDTQVMERLRDGDDDALAVLVERYQHELVGFFYHHCWDQLVSEELAQTVFIKLFRARSRYRPTAKLRTYLYRIAHNAWIDHLRRQRKHLSLDAEIGGEGLRVIDTLASDFDPERAGRDAVIRHRIQVAVENLPAGQRDVFVLANNQGLKYHDISAVLGIPEGTIKSRMHAAVRTLRRHLADLLEDA